MVCLKRIKDTDPKKDQSLKAKHQTMPSRPLILASKWSQSECARGSAKHDSKNSRTIKLHLAQKDLDKNPKRGGYLSSVEWQSGCAVD